MTFLQYLLSNKHKNTLTSCMLRTSALTILCKPCSYKFMSIDFLRLRFAKSETWSDRIADSTKLSNLCSERRVILLSTYLLLESHLYFFPPWTTGWETGSRTAGSSSLIQGLKPELRLIPPWLRPFIWKSFGVGGPANSLPCRDSEPFGDDELLRYSLTNLSIICLPPKGKKNDRKV